MNQNQMTKDLMAERTLMTMLVAVFAAHLLPPEFVGITTYQFKNGPRSQVLIIDLRDIASSLPDYDESDPCQIAVVLNDEIQKLTRNVRPFTRPLEVLDHTSFKRRARLIMMLVSALNHGLLEDVTPIVSTVVGEA